MKGLVTAQQNFDKQAKVECIATYWWDRDIKFLNAITESSLPAHHNFNKSSDEVAINLCKAFIEDFDPDKMIAQFGESKGGYGYQETYCNVYKILETLTMSDSNLLRSKTMSDKLQVNVMDGDKIAKSYTHQRVVITVLAAQIGMSTSEIQQLLTLSDEELQTKVDAITAELNKLKNK